MANFGILSQWILPQMPNVWLSQKIVQAIRDHASSLISEKSPLILVNYNEPSLAFYLGTKKVMQAPADLKKLETNSSLVLINTESYDILKKQPAVSGRIMASISAYNYSHGKWETYNLARLTHG
jgi:hypothetical protein